VFDGHRGPAAHLFREREVAIVERRAVVPSGRAASICHWAAPSARSTSSSTSRISDGCAIAVSVRAGVPSASVCSDGRASSQACAAASRCTEPKRVRRPSASTTSSTDQSAISGTASDAARRSVSS
jgi:hypothetical protein